jgi:prophage DNA circulation protein
MSWKDKIKEAKYTAPSGTEFVFGWEKVKKQTELKTGTYTFPSRDGAHVQHQGAGARTFPLTCIFSGENCIDEADAFEDALIETGVGELQHPVYGIRKVKPTGNIVREDDLVSALNESTVTITFTETITDEEAAKMDEVAVDSIEESYDEFADAAAEDFAETLAATPESPLAEGISEQLRVQAALTDQTNIIIDNMQPLAMADKKSFADWLASANELKDTIKNLYTKGKRAAEKVESVYVKALNIARLTLRIMKLPSDLSVSLAEKIKGYSNLTAQLINQFQNDPFGVKNIKNAFATARLGLTGAVASVAAGASTSTARAAVSSAEASAQAATADAAIASGATGSGTAAGGSANTGGGGSSGGGSSGSGGAGEAHRGEAVPIQAVVPTAVAADRAPLITIRLRPKRRPRAASRPALLLF